MLLTPIRYGVLSRMADAFFGIRDGVAGVPRKPRVSEQKTGVIFTTGYRESLIRRALEGFEQEHERYAPGAAQHEAAEAMAQARLAQELHTLDEAEQRLAAASRPPAPAELAELRHGEHDLGPLIVRHRRLREHLRRLEAAQERVRAARAHAAEAQGTVEAAEARTLRWHEEVHARVMRIHQHTHDRLAQYRSWLVRWHPQAGWVNRVMGMDRLEVPGWAVPVTLMPPPAPPPSDMDEPQPPPPDPLPADRTIVLKPVTHFGSADDADVVIPGYGVAPRHFTLTREADGWRLRGYGHDRGPYIDGQEVKTALLHPGGQFTAAGYRYTIGEDNKTVEETVLGRCDLIVAGLCAGTRLDRMSFVQRERVVLAVLGPSGAGKTSLFWAIMGELETTGGELFFNGRNVRTHVEEIRNMLGFVPQHEHLYETLTVRKLLTYVDRLRWTSGTAGRGDRVEEVCEGLGLSDHINKVVSKLSGGQKKRVSIAMELMTRPRLLMLDEPTSGLDPGMDREVMKLLREYAEQGNTVITITHTTEHLHYAQQVLIVAEGGRPIYSGPLRQMWPTLGLKRGADGFADLMEALQDPDGYAEAYQSSHAAKEALLEAERADEHHEPPEEIVRRRRWRVFFRQLPALIGRQVALVLARGRAGRRRPGKGGRWAERLSGLRTIAVAAIPLVMAVVGAALAGFVSRAEGLGAGPSAAGPMALSLLATASVLIGQSLTYSDVVDEYHIIKREFRTGMVPAAVLTSKFVVFMGVSVLQALVVTFLFVTVRPGPAYSLVLGGWWELFACLALTTIAAMSLGLLISVIAHDLKQAVVLNTVVIIAQIALNGVASNLANDWTIGSLAAVFPARWGLAAAAASVDLRTIAPLAAHPDPLWQHTVGHLALNLGMLALITAVCFAAALRVLGRRLRMPD